MLCPKCNESMVLETIKGFEVEQCPQCNGHWLDRVTVAAILDQTGSPFTTAAFDSSLLKLAAGDSGLTCPHCKEASLALADLEDVEVEICTTCSGIFFDAGEVRSIREAGVACSRRIYGRQAVEAAGEAAPGLILEELLFGLWGK